SAPHLLLPPHKVNESSLPPYPERRGIHSRPARRPPHKTRHDDVPPAWCKIPARRWRTLADCPARHIAARQPVPASGGNRQHPACLLRAAAASLAADRDRGFLPAALTE